LGIAAGEAQEAESVLPPPASHDQSPVPPDRDEPRPSLRARLGSLSWLEVIGLVAPALVLGLLSLRDLGLISFWRDEVSSVYFAQGSLSELLTIIGRDRAKVGLANMATYYLILHFWLIVGETEARIRLLSVLFGVAAVVPVYFVARRLAGWLGGAAAAGIFALIPFVIAYNQQARGYSLAILMVATLTWLVLVGVERRAVWPWAAYGVIAALGLYVHFFVALVIAAHGLWVLATRSVPPWRAALAALIPLLVATAPIPLIIAQYGGEHEWIPPLNGARIRDALTDLAGSPLLLAIFAALILLGAYLYRRDARYWLLVASALAPIVGGLLISLVKPFFIPRYLIVSVPAMAVLAGCVLAAIRPNLLRAAAALGMAAALVLALPAAYDHESRINWRSAGRWVAEEAQPGDQIVMVSWVQSPLMYYMQRTDADIVLEHVSVQEALGAEGQRLWLAVTHAKSSVVDQMVGRLAPSYELRASRSFGRGTQIVLLVPRS
jgi:hypothetical protein